MALKLNHTLQHFVRVNLPDAITKGSSFTESPHVAYKDSFISVHESFVSADTKEKGVDPMVSGTTAVCAMFEGTKCYIANVGDSRAILGYRNERGELVPKPLSIDHKPNLPSEKVRLEATSALLMTEKEVRGFGDENKVSYLCYTERYFLLSMYVLDICMSGKGRRYTIWNPLYEVIRRLRYGHV